METITQKLKTKNNFDKYLVFKFAKFEDLQKIQNFYKSHWPYKNLITEDYVFLIYEFADNLNLNFLLAENNKTGEIESVIGFYSYSKDSSYKHICGSMSLVKPRSAYPLLGIETLKRLKKLTNCVSYCGTNTNEVTMLPLVKKFLKHHTSKMNQFYILNDKKKSFNIAIVNSKFLIKNKQIDNNIFLNEIKNIRDLLETKIFYKVFERIPFKSLEYILKKYFLHPIYKYNAYSIIKNNSCEGVLFTRTVKHNKSYVLRIIDFIGNYKIIPFLDSSLYQIIIKNNYEYVDIISNLPFQLFGNSLFMNNSESNDIIPHYFEPFLRKNIQVFYETDNKNLFFFKGDADGDRPNFLRKK